MIPFAAIVRELPASIPFVGPEAVERRTGRPFEIRAGANESAFGASPSAAEAMRAAIERVSRDGDPRGRDLRAALSAAARPRAPEAHGPPRQPRPPVTSMWAPVQ